MTCGQAAARRRVPRWGIKVARCAQIDVTPISRTLHTSFSGIRSMSVLETPPPGRLSVKTIVCERSDALIAHAVELQVEAAAYDAVARQPCQHCKVAQRVTSRWRLKALANRPRQRIAAGRPARAGSRRASSYGTRSRAIRSCLRSICSRSACSRTRSSRRISVLWRATCPLHWTGACLVC